MEKIELRITRPDFVTYFVSFTDVKITRGDDGTLVYKNCNKLLCAYYPKDWAIEITSLNLSNGKPFGNDCDS